MVWQVGANGLAIFHAVAYICSTHAGIAQLVERNLAKVEVAGSSPVSRSAPSNRGTGAFGNRAERLL